MSRVLGEIERAKAGFPRVSGDEPRNERKAENDYLFSPRERG